MTAIIICSIIFIICVLCVPFAHYKQNQGLFDTALAILILDSIMGFGIFCTCNIVKTDEFIINPDAIVRSATTIYIEKSGMKTIEKTEHLIYSAKDENIRIKKTVTYNSYGFASPPIFSVEIVPNLEK